MSEMRGLDFDRDFKMILWHFENDSTDRKVFAELSDGKVSFR